MSKQIDKMKKVVVIKFKNVKPLKFCLFSSGTLEFERLSKI